MWALEKKTKNYKPASKIKKNEGESSRGSWRRSKKKEMRKNIKTKKTI